MSSKWKRKYFVLRRFPPRYQLSDLQLDHYVSRVLENEVCRFRVERDILEYEEEQKRIRNDNTKINP